MPASLIILPSRVPQAAKPLDAYGLAWKILCADAAVTQYGAAIENPHTTTRGSGMNVPAVQWPGFW